MDLHSVEVVGALPLESHQFPDVGEVNMKHIAVECHFPHIGSHAGDPSLGHAVSDQRLFLRRHHHMKMDGAPPLFRQRSSRSRLRRLGGCSRTLSSGFSSRGGIGRLLMMPSISNTFDEALQTLSKEKQKDSLAAIGECYCSWLFKLEQTFAELTPEE